MANDVEQLLVLTPFKPSKTGNNTEKKATNPTKCMRGTTFFFIFFFFKFKTVSQCLPASRLSSSSSSMSVYTCAHERLWRFQPSVHVCVFPASLHDPHLVWTPYPSPITHSLIVMMHLHGHTYPPRPPHTHEVSFPSSDDIKQSVECRLLTQSWWFVLRCC